MLRIISWHLSGYLLITFGVFLAVGDLVADVGFWPAGLALVAIGTWGWTRGVRARKELSPRGSKWSFTFRWGS